MYNTSNHDQWLSDLPLNQRLSRRRRSNGNLGRPGPENIVQKFHLEKNEDNFCVSLPQGLFCCDHNSPSNTLSPQYRGLPFLSGEEMMRIFFIGKLGFLTKWKSTLEIMSNQSCFNIETTVDHLNNVDLLLTGRRKMDDLLHPRLVDAMQKGDRRLKPHTLRKKLASKTFFSFFSPEGIWGRSLVSCWRTGCSLHSSACAQSFDPRPWAIIIAPEHLFETNYNRPWTFVWNQL